MKIPFAGTFGLTLLACLLALVAPHAQASDLFLLLLFQLPSSRY